MIALRMVISLFTSTCRLISTFIIHNVVEFMKYNSHLLGLRYCSPSHNIFLYYFKWVPKVLRGIL